MYEKGIQNLKYLVETLKDIFQRKKAKGILLPKSVYTNNNQLSLYVCIVLKTDNCKLTILFKRNEKIVHLEGTVKKCALALTSKPSRCGANFIRNNLL